MADIDKKLMGLLTIAGSGFYWASYILKKRENEENGCVFG